MAQTMIMAVNISQFYAEKFHWKYDCFGEYSLLNLTSEEAQRQKKAGDNSPT